MNWHRQSAKVFTRMKLKSVQLRIGLLYQNKLMPEKRGEAGLLCNDKCWFPQRYLKWFDPVILLNHRQEMINVLLMRPLQFYLSLCLLQDRPGCWRCLLCLHMPLKSTLTLTKSQQCKLQKKITTCIPSMLWKNVRKLKSNTQSHCSANAPFLKSTTNLKKSHWNSTLSAFVDIIIIFLQRLLFFFFFKCLFPPS